MKPLHPNCRCIDTSRADREVGPRAVARTLECLGGPHDGERLHLQADEDAILVHAEGTYVPVATPKGERLRWLQI